MSNIKNKKVTTFSDASKFWWSIFWRSHFVSIILLLTITLILFLLSSNQDISSIMPTFLQIIYPGSYQAITFLIFILIFFRILRNNINSTKITAIFWSFFWRYAVALTTIYIIWICTFYLILSLSFNINQELYIPRWNFDTDRFLVCLISTIVGIIVISYICLLNRKSISILIAICIIFALIAHILSPFFFLFLYKSDSFFIHSYPTTFNNTVDNLLMAMYMFVIIGAISLKIRIYQIIFNKGLVKYSKVKNYNITKIKIGKFSI